MGSVFYYHHILLMRKLRHSVHCAQEIKSFWHIVRTQEMVSVTLSKSVKSHRGVLLMERDRRVVFSRVFGTA